MHVGRFPENFSALGPPVFEHDLFYRKNSENGLSAPAARVRETRVAMWRHDIHYVSQGPSKCQKIYFVEKATRV
jgi:hypothetical protein